MREIEPVPQYELDDAQVDILDDIPEPKVWAPPEPEEDVQEIVLPQDVLDEIARVSEPAPRRLRPSRALMGIALLALAWACAVVAVLLGAAFLSVFDGNAPTALDVLLDIVLLLAVGWLAVVGLGSLIVGAFSLSLAVTRRNW